MKKGKEKTNAKKVKVQPKKQKQKYIQTEIQFPEPPTFTNH